MSTRQRTIGLLLAGRCVLALAAAGRQPRRRTGHDDGPPAPPEPRRSPPRAPAPEPAAPAPAPSEPPRRSAPERIARRRRPAAGTGPAGPGQHRSARRARAPPSAAPVSRNARPTGAAGASGAPAPPGTRRAPAPSALTPALPLALSGSLAGVPSFFIENFRVPPFLLPIYQAAGSAYGIPWQVLAAINEVETDYGRDLSVSSAGAEGWMQFLPTEWAQYGVDATGSGFKDPYNPADAIFAAARYLRAAGGDTNIRAAIFSYNHSQAYVTSVLQRAELLGGTPPQLLGAVIGLTEARFPVHAAAHFSDGFQTIPASGSQAGADARGHDDLLRSRRARDRRAGRGSRADRQLSDAGAVRRAARRVRQHVCLLPARLGRELYPVLRPAPGAHVSASAAPAGRRLGATAEPPPERAGFRRCPDRRAAFRRCRLAGAGRRWWRWTPPRLPRPPGAAPHRTGRRRRSASSGKAPDEVYLHPLRVGVQVIAGTVLGPSSARSGQMFFQIRPAAVGAPLIDPKPILDGWVALENTAVRQPAKARIVPRRLRRRRRDRCCWRPQRQLERQVLRDHGVRLGRCERQAIQGGRRRPAAAGDARVPLGVGPEADRHRASPAAASLAGARTQRAGAARRKGRPHGGQLARDRDHQGSGSIAEIDRSTAADAAGLHAASTDHQPGPLSRAPRSRSSSSERSRLHPVRLQRADAERRACRRRRSAPPLSPNAVDRADRAARRDPQSDGREQALARGRSPTRSRPAAGPVRRRLDGRPRTERWQRLAPPAAPGAPSRRLRAVLAAGARRPARRRRCSAAASPRSARSASSCWSSPT